MTTSENKPATKTSTKKSATKIPALPTKNFRCAIHPESSGVFLLQNQQCSHAARLV